MKKLFAIVLVLCLLLTSLCALAEEAPAVNELNWSDVEPYLAEAGWQGDFATFDEVAVKLWVPTVLSALELTDEDREAGYIGYFTTEDQSASVAVMYVDMGGMELDAYAQQLADVGATEIESGIINGLGVLTYMLADTDTACISIASDTGYILEFAFAPISDEGFASVASIMMASIQPE